MSLNRYAAKRDKNEPEIIQAFEEMGCSVTRLNAPMDLLIGHEGLNLIVGVKTKAGKLTPAQKEFISRHKGTYAVVRSVEEAKQLIENLSAS